MHSTYIHTKIQMPPFLNTFYGIQMTPFINTLDDSQRPTSSRAVGIRFDYRSAR